MHQKKALTVVGVTALLSGCAPTLFMGAATSVTTSFAEERGVGGVVSDADIKSRIHLKWLGYNAALSNKIDVVVRQGSVLLTGNVDSPQMQIDAVRLAWEVVGVREVMNETKVTNESSFAAYAKDGWIATRVRSKVFFDNDVRSLNYTIQCNQGIVYLMGIAQNQGELDRVIDHARTTNGVKEVISYVKLKPPSGIPGTSDPIKQPLSSGQKPAESYSQPLDNDVTVIDVETLDGPNTGSAFQ